MRLSVSRLTLVVVLLALQLPAQDTHYAQVGQQIPAPGCIAQKGAWEGGSKPCTTEDFDAWLKDITHWRTERKIRIGYSNDRYQQPAFKWAQSAFMQPQMMVQDRYFYDPVAGKYTVDRYLEDLEKRYGGIDAVLIWPTYPNMGIDNRNQHDMIRSMPGGLPGVRQMVADFHGRGVHILFPMMMWDQGTRDPGMPWPQAIAEIMKEIGADGVNGDTQDGVPLAFSLAADKSGHPLVFEPEGSPSDEALAWNVLTWGQYKFEFAPKVDRFRWLEPRHQVNISDRWNRDKTDDLQYAFFNGEGWESWENIWGIWNGITPRDEEATRRVATIERAVAPFFASEEWQPFYPTHLYGVFASKWPLGQQTVWTIVNRNEYDIAGRQISIPYAQGVRYFDLYHGVELTPEHDGDQAVLSFAMEAHGYGALLATPGEPDAPITQLMAKTKQMAAAPLSGYSHEWKPLPQHLVEIPKTEPAATAPEGMVKIPAADYVFKVEGIEIEGFNDAGVDVQYPWEDIPRRYHEHEMHIASFYIDKYPVANAEFKKFLDATHYHPSDDLNFLKDWKDGTFPDGSGNKPVTWVSQEDARAYAKWAGKRLPHEWEWQYSAQGTDGRIYPWGNDWDASKVPVPDRSRTMRGPNDVDAHPAGASPFGVMDLVGNVWQWTDEYVDEHTRGGILRGGSYYQPQGSIWYFPQAYRNDQHGKLLLMAPSYDRSGALGFRCVKDAD
ncbi:formylglycine-generating enzyme family protein [Alloacidobacterium dinghuense]|uniref:Formylglycine-generating enzyme family protein n=1 Tax=Alloacidobacterium dinghuense TaxID=2763107 RepID=A0A7G8BKV0_9BACT|nr:SUMF1/EgtB/PvdO family nonheme iron enzyme [Alloacidobacterium dinghuense]QNI33170.1 formylglycine-generating enzyme family protein [Alloacidobacterium dinghuense]